MTIARHVAYSVMLLIAVMIAFCAKSMQQPHLPCSMNISACGMGCMYLCHSTSQQMTICHAFNLALQM